MDWTAQIDAYCERMGPGFWAEPVNALTNAAFVISAMLVWYKLGTGRDGLGLARVLAVNLFVIGLGSFLFHSFATRWALVSDVVPIVSFILIYIYAVNRSILGWGRIWSGLGMLGFLPFAALTIPVFRALGMGSSAAYGPVPLLIVLYALLPLRARPELARKFLVGAGILCLSLAARMADLPICARVPLGTHFLWHCLNALMLGWMIMAYARGALEARNPAR